MDDLERIKKHHGGPHTDGVSQLPYWKRMHKSPFFWIAVVFIMVAMIIFIITDGFLFHPAAVMQAAAH
jgi:hypothetical protein